MVLLKNAILNLMKKASYSQNESSNTKSERRISSLKNYLTPKIIQGRKFLNISLVSLLIISLGIAVYLYFQNRFLSIQTKKLQAESTKANREEDSSGRIPFDYDLFNLDSWIDYTNQEYKYTLKYPPYFLLDDKSLTYVTIKIPKVPNQPEGEVLSLINIDVEEGNIEESAAGKPLSFEEFIIERLKGGCAADGNCSYYCDKTINQSPISNPYGINGLEVLLRLVTKCKESVSYDEAKGPIYALNITPKNSTKFRALILTAGYGFPDGIEREVLRKIVDTLKI